MTLLKNSITLSRIYIKLFNLLPFKLRLFFLERKQSSLERSIRRKSKIKVVFLIIHKSVWKYDYLYELLEKSSIFEPVIVVCPFTHYDDKNMWKELNETFEYFNVKKFKVINSYNYKNNTWIDVNQSIRPDIVFFTNPYSVTKFEYLIESFFNCLTCYVPYNFGNSSLLKMFHDQDFHNYLWKLFCETEFHKDYSVRIARNKGRNVITTGYPGTDKFLMRNSQCRNVWKNVNKYKIIWAPHHTIEDNQSLINYSSFLYLQEFMLDLLIRFYDTLEICFKPHPLLKPKLYQHSEWGVDKTDAYYSKWKDSNNSNLNEGDYVDLFQSSDALIHDSGSFLIEYLYTEKPVLRTDKNDSIKMQLNDFAKQAYDLHYIAFSKNDILTIINNLLVGSDPKKELRIEFKNKFLIPPHNVFASENIYNELIKLVR
jgi:hypothetical protein